MTRQTLRDKLDRFYWDQVCRSKWHHRQAMRDYLRILCRILDIEFCDIYPCTTDRYNACLAKNENNTIISTDYNSRRHPCGGACYNPVDKCIYYRDGIGWSLILQELFHHVNALNDHAAIEQIMWAWYNSLTQKTDISKYFRGLKSVEEYGKYIRKSSRKRRRKRTKKRR